MNQKLLKYLLTFTWALGLTSLMASGVVIGYLYGVNDIPSNFDFLRSVSVKTPYDDLPAEVRYRPRSIEHTIDFKVLYWFEPLAALVGVALVQLSNKKLQGLQT